jgi:hypothetical protein
MKTIQVSHTFFSGMQLSRNWCFPLDGYPVREWTAHGGMFVVCKKSQFRAFAPHSSSDGGGYKSM